MRTRHARRIRRHIGMARGFVKLQRELLKAEGLGHLTERESALLLDLVVGRTTYRLSAKEMRLLESVVGRVVDKEQPLHNHARE